jgi:ADP-ribosylglycohydrolase
MIGAIAGDIIGSVYEWSPIKTTAFPLFQGDSRFTDDTVLTCAVAEHLLDGTPLPEALRRYCQAYPRAGYGGTFLRWAASPGAGPYNSWGNGSAMRASPVGWAFSSLDDTIAAARRSAEVTHNHPEGVKGAEATAAAVFLARTGTAKEAIREIVEERFGYDLSTPLDRLRPAYRFDVSCQGSVPQAIRAFLESDDYETAVRLAVSLGGDADTQACIAGGVAEAFYGGVPEAVRDQALARLDAPLAAVVHRFRATHGCP